LIQWWQRTTVATKEGNFGTAHLSSHHVDMAQIATNTVETVNSTSRHQKTFIIGSILRSEDSPSPVWQSA
jgi:hypothetical protein